MDDDDAPFTLEHSERDGLTLLALGGDLDLAASPALEEALEAVSDSERRVVLDLRGLRFMDSTGLALILRYHQRAEAQGFDLVVVRGVEDVDRVFRVTGTDAKLELLDVPPAA